MVANFDVYLKDKSRFTYVHGSPWNEDIIPHDFTITKSVPVSKYLGKNTEAKLWGNSVVEKGLLANTLKDCLQIVSETFGDVCSVGPMHMMCSRKLIRANNGIGIVSEEGLSFFWEAKNRLNMLVIPSEEVVTLGAGGKILDIELTVSNAVCRRSSKAEMFTNQRIRFQPAVGNNIDTNTIALTNFMTYVAWLDPYLG
jgi:hypothetical protein